MVRRPSSASSASSAPMSSVSSTFSNDISSETAGPIEPKLNVEPPWGRETKVF